MNSINIHFARIATLTQQLVDIQKKIEKRATKAKAASAKKAA